MRPSLSRRSSVMRAISRRRGVETGEDHGVGCVVHQQFHAGDRFEGADVAPFAPDDAALDLVRGQHNLGDGALVAQLQARALHGTQQDLAGLLVGVQAGLLADLVEMLHRFPLDLLLQVVEQVLAGLLAGHGRDGFQAGILLVDELVHLLLVALQLQPVVLQQLFLVFQVQLAGLAQVRLLLQGQFAFAQVVLAVLQLVLGLVAFLLQQVVLAGTFLGQLEAGFVFQRLGGLVGLRTQLFGLADPHPVMGMGPAHGQAEPDGETRQQGDNRRNDHDRKGGHGVLYLIV
jgi:hypothetical protein